MEEAAGNLTRSLRKSVKNKKMGGGGSFSDRFTPQKGATGKITPIVLFKTNYVTPVALEDGRGSRKFEAPYGLILRHYHKKSNKFGRCSAGLADIRDSDGNVIIGVGKKPCLGCNEAAKGKETGMAWAKKLHVFNGILMADFHLVDSDRKSESTGAYYKDFVQCEGRACKYCDNGIVKQFGRRVYWPLGPSFTDQLADFGDSLGTNCECGGTITIPAYECSKCGSCFQDLESNPASPEELEEIQQEEHRCNNCGFTGYMDPVHECDSCNQAKPLELWDVQVEYYRSGEGTNTSLQQRRFKVLSAAEWKKITPLMNPVDLDKVFPFLTIREQSKLYKLQVPPELRDNAVEEETRRADGDESTPRSGSHGWEEDED